MRRKAERGFTKLCSESSAVSGATFIIAIHLVHWRLLQSAAHDGPENMAVDHALMDRARRTREWVLRVYAWSAPVLSLGRNQRAQNVYDVREMTRRGIGLVRRPTGGRALLHHREVTYSVTGPVTPGESLTAAYERINALLVSALDSLGVATTIATPERRAAAPDGMPCFAEPAAGEIVAGGRKLVGSAQWRDEGALLQHGSIIVDDDQSRISELMLVPPLAAPPPATLRHLLGRPPEPRAVAEALFSAVRTLADANAEPLAAREIRELDVDAYLERYRDESWTWRR
jgi:lipoate-protein ligase A